MYALHVWHLGSLVFRHCGHQHRRCRWTPGLERTGIRDQRACGPTPSELSRGAFERRSTAGDVRQDDSHLKAEEASEDLHWSIVIPDAQISRNGFQCMLSWETHFSTYLGGSFGPDAQLPSIDCSPTPPWPRQDETFGDETSAHFAFEWSCHRFRIDQPSEGRVGRRRRARRRGCWGANNQRAWCAHVGV